MTPTLLVVVDTLRADEVAWMPALVARAAHRGTVWGVAPYTLPAMTSLLTGRIDHGVFLPGSHRDQPDTLALDYPSAVAITGRGFADGPSMGFARGFRAWRSEKGDACLPEPDAVPDAAMVLLHTFELHQYVQEPWEGSTIHAAVAAGEPPPKVVLQVARRRRLQRIERRLLALLDAFPHARVVVTSDHGEELDPPRVGHGATFPPSDALLRLPLLVFGPSTPPPAFLPLHEIRRWLRGEAVPTDPVPLVWPACDGVPERRVTLTPDGLRSAA